MSTEGMSGRLRPTLRVFVTLVLLVFCAVTEVFVLPMHQPIVAPILVGRLGGFVTAALSVIPWVVGLVVAVAVLVTARAPAKARPATAATALAAVDVALVLWVASLGLAFLDFAIKMTSLSTPLG